MTASTKELSFNQYQEKASETAIYKETYYPFASLMIEAAEFCDLITKQQLRGDLKGVWRDEMVAEAGDVLWNLAECLSQYGIKLQEVADYNVAKLASRKDRGMIMGDGGSR